MAGCWSFSWGNGNQLRREKKEEGDMSQLGSQLAAWACFSGSGSLPEQQRIFSEGRSLATWPSTFQRLVFRSIVKHTKKPSAPLFLLQRALPVAGKRNSGCTKNWDGTLGSLGECVQRTGVDPPLLSLVDWAKHPSGLACWCTANIHGLLGLKGA